MKDTELEKLVVTEEKLLKSFAGRTFLITGATGLIGSAVCRVLLESNRRYGTGIRILASFRNRTKFEAVFGSDADRLEKLESDVSSLAEIFDYREKPDFILHCASQTDSKSFLKNPLETINTALSGVRSVIEIGRHYPDCRVLNFSTQEVYGDAPEGRDLASRPWKEDELGFLDLYSARNSYPVVKRCCENICFCERAVGNVNVATVRLAQTFGVGVPYGDNRVFAQFARNVLHGDDIVLLTAGTLKREFLDVYDSVSAFLHILASGVKESCYNISNSDSFMSIRELADLFASKNKDISVIIRIDNEAARKFTKTKVTRLDCARLRETGWHPLFTMNDSIQSLLDWYDSLGYGSGR